jgi:hypothetical protein
LNKAGAPAEVGQELKVNGLHPLYNTRWGRLPYSVVVLCLFLLFNVQLRPAFIFFTVNLRGMGYYILCPKQAAKSVLQLAQIQAGVSEGEMLPGLRPNPTASQTSFRSAPFP